MNDEVRNEKIHVYQGDKVYVYTGRVDFSKRDGWVRIATTHNEKLLFRVEQVVKREVLDRQEPD